MAILHAVAFCIWEARFAKEPIVPFDIWSRPSFGPLLLVVFFSLMSFGILLWYLVVWERDVRHYTMSAVGGSMAPFIFVSGGMAVVSALLVPLMRIEFIMSIGVVALIVATILPATMPIQQVYWAQAFPSAIIAGAGPDLLLTAAQVIASTTVRRSEQGLAGSLIGVLQTYGLSTGLGFAGTVEVHVNRGGATDSDKVAGYRGALYLAIGFLVVALVVNVLFVRMPAETQQGWKENDLEKRERSQKKETQSDGEDAV